jgi:hypothetical protein
MQSERKRLQGVTSPGRCAIEPAMITIAASNFWYYFSYDSSLAVGGSCSI